MLRKGYDQWLKWMGRTNPKALREAPPDRATMDRLRLWLEDLDRVRIKTRLHYVESTVRVLIEAEPDQDWTAQRRLVARLKRSSGTGDPERKIGRIFDSGRLLQIGLDYARSHEKDRPTPLEQAARFRTGTMIAFLATMPLRRKALCGLQLGTSIIVAPDRILISASGDMMKRGNTWEAEVPAAVAPTLRHYLTTIRPWLMARHDQRHSYLWVNDRGKPFDPAHLSNRIAWATKEILGTRVSAHLFRDAAATTLARHAPENARMIAPLLGHTNLEIAERHYIQANSIDAGRAYANVVAHLMRR
jgi:integrase